MTSYNRVQHNLAESGQSLLALRNKIKGLPQDSPALPYLHSLLPPLVGERRRLLTEQATLQREIKRQADEDSSNFAQRPVLSDRYLTLSLLGRGGFSEVWLSYDLLEFQHVAIKVHHCSERWSEAKKEQYVRHATREYNIHESLRHPHVVRLHRVFEIDNDTFATVLEHCGGAIWRAADAPSWPPGRGRAHHVLVQVLPFSILRKKSSL